MEPPAMLIQTIDQAIIALETAGFKSFGGGDSAKFFDPYKRGAFCTLVSGFSNAQFSDYVDTTQKTMKKGGPSPVFVAKLQRVLEADRQRAIAAQGK
jgi:hypothetical protein